MKYLIPILLLSALLSGCEKLSLKEGEPIPTEIIIDALEDAYADESISDYTKLLEDWKDTVLPKKISSLDLEIEKDIYKIFQVIYNPFDISKLGEHEWNELYEGYEYAVIQNRVNYNYAYEEENEWDNIDSLLDFRPEITLHNKTILYLSTNYHEAIYTFLGLEFDPLGTGGIMNPAQPTGDSQKRLDFLQEHLAIIPGHWGGYYHIATHPEINLVKFNAKADKACVYFRVGYMFGEAEFEKKLTNWKMTSSSITGIEK